MPNRQQLLLAFTASLLVIANSANAQTPQSVAKIQRYTKQAEQAFKDEFYKKAESSWLNVIKELQKNEQENQELANALKRLGETYTKEQKFEEAEATLKRSTQLYEKLGTPDQEVAQDLVDLGKAYKPVDTSCLGQNACEILKEANLKSVVLLKTDKGNKVQIKLPQRFTKKIADSPDVDQVGLEKTVTFDIEETPDGTIRVSNIKGLKVHAHMWVTLQESQLKRNAQGERVADITAQKMGISKTVSATLPALAYEPIDGLIKQFRDFASGTISTVDALVNGSQSIISGNSANTQPVNQDKLPSITSDTTSQTDITSDTSITPSTNTTVNTGTTPGDTAEPVAIDPLTGEPITAPQRNDY